MKIHRGKHIIEQVDNVDFREHIPLSYIDTPNVNKVNVEFTPSIMFYDGETKEEVMPYDYFDNRNVVLFDSDDKLIDNKKHLQDNRKGGYFFMPKVNDIEQPTFFDHRILYKRDGMYQHDKYYNINVGIVENFKDEKFTKKLLPLFGRSNQIGISASNVIINKGDLSTKVFKENHEADILFIESEDGIHYSNTTIKIDYDEYKKMNKNLWIICGNEFENEYVEVKKEEDSFSTVETNIAFSSEKYKSDFVFYNKNFPGAKELKLINGQNTMSIFENINNNYIIYSHKDMLNNLMENAKAIHEIILYIYLNKYKFSNWKESWIYKTIPDYEYKNGQLYKKKEFSEEIERKSNYQILKAETNNDEIGYEIRGNKIIFEYKEKENYNKNINNITVFSHDRRILNLDNKDKIYKKSLYPKVKKLEYDEKQIEMLFSGPIHSEKGINHNKDIEFKKKIDTTKEGNYKFFLNMVNNIPKFEEAPRRGEVLGILDIEIISDANLYMNDIRQLGGGLKEEREDNFNMLDIGNSFGRPIRKGGSTIITLPKSMEKYDARIRETIEQHKVADRYYYIIYKEGGTYTDEE